MSTEQKFLHTHHGDTPFLSKDAIVKLLEEHKKFVLINHDKAKEQIWSANYEQKRSRSNGIY
jgi:molybdopterin-guanine dinucleotide biosynthesis protein A